MPYGAGAASSPLPYDLWRGVDAAGLEALLKGAPLPSPSPVLADLMARALATGDADSADEAMVRAQALRQAGRIDEALALLQRATQGGPANLLGTYALTLLASGRADQACEVNLGDALPSGNDGTFAKEALLVPVYCGATSGDLAGARLALQLARDNGADVGIAAAVLAQRRPSVPRQVGLMDYLFLSLGKQRPEADLAAKAEPELLFFLARDGTAPAELRAAAAERAAALNIISGEELARAYRETAKALPKSAQAPSALRAKLFASFENAPSVKIRAESIMALLASARDQGIEAAIAEALAQASAKLMQDPQAASFAETGIRVAALAGDEENAWAWIDAGGERLKNFELLLAATDPLGSQAETALAHGVELAHSGALPAPLLHRLVTVLDALDYNVPIPLWDEANKTPQPDEGELPPTGALTRLKEAADAGEIGRTIFLVAAVLGRQGPKGAHLIALSDSIRALKRVGLDAEARRLGFEALYAHWPWRGKV